MRRIDIPFCINPREWQHVDRNATFLGRKVVSNGKCSYELLYLDSDIGDNFRDGGMILKNDHGDEYDDKRLQLIFTDVYVLPSEIESLGEMK